MKLQAKAAEKRVKSKKLILTFSFKLMWCTHLTINTSLTFMREKERNHKNERPRKNWKFTLRKTHSKIIYMKGKLYSSKILG